MFEIGEIFICDGVMCVIEGELHWENNLARKRGGLVAKLSEKFRCPPPSDYWKTWETPQHVHLS